MHENNITTITSLIVSTIIANAINITTTTTTIITITTVIVKMIGVGT